MKPFNFLERAQLNEHEAKLILDPVIGTFSYLLFVGWADVEAGHNDSCPWHQVEFGVGGPIVSRPEGREKNKKLNTNDISNIFEFCLERNKISVVKDILGKIWTILLHLIVKLQQVPFH